MRYDAAKSFLRRRVQSGATWSRFRRLLITYQYFLRSPDEAEIRVFRSLGALGVPRLIFADIGANGGQTAVSVARVLPTARIESFEPNPTLWPELKWVERLVGERFHLNRFGLGAENGSLTLYVPHAGDLPVTTRASLSESVASGRLGDLASETGRIAEVKPVDVEIRRFDDLGLLPHGIKIDVEGLELSVLEGMRATIEQCRPLLMLEHNDETPRCRELLSAFGYDFWEYDPSTESLHLGPEPRTRNWFAVPDHRALRTALGLG